MSRPPGTGDQDFREVSGQGGSECDGQEGLWRPEEPVRIPIADVFDLHSVPDRDLRPVIEEYLREAHALGLRFIRLIHGRGIGVRREIVRSVLAQTEFVDSYGDAPAEAGGWGATVAVLRPAKQPE